MPHIQIDYWPISRFRPYERNPRKNDQAVKRMVASIQEFSFAIPMLARSSGEVVDGHLRLKAGLQLGMTELPVILCDGWTEAQVKAFRLMVNRSVSWAEWDKDALAMEFGELKAMDFDLGLTGFEMNEIERYLPPASDPNEDEVPPVPEAPVSRRGDLWLMGEHRLLCGDSTSAEHVGRLMRGELADLIFTDPPYGVGYDGGTVVREKLRGDENTDLYSPCCATAAQFSKRGAALYLWHAGIKGIAAAAAVAAAAAGYDIRCELVWNKQLAQFGSLSAQYKQKHEPCYYCVRRGSPPAWYGPTNEVTVWDCDRARANELHPTQKPVELARRALANSSKGGDIVFDGFLGGGSTLIAAELTGRRCFGLEIAPEYCDVIVTRWEKLTGKQATLEGIGATFAHVRDGRRLEAQDGLKEEILKSAESQKCFPEKTVTKSLKTRKSKTEVLA